MSETTVIMTFLSFVITMILIFWRPRGMNEAIPATMGAILVLVSGSVSLGDLAIIGEKVTGAAVTIMATLVMAIALESFGFFHWAALTLLRKSRGSGIKLFWLSNLLCFLMTLFLNNDGSILITTPILILILRYLGMKNAQKLPYLISGALIATAASAPIGVSNIVNLIALKVIGMDLYLHTAMMFVPGIIGLLFLAGLLFAVFWKDIPSRIPAAPRHTFNKGFSRLHPLQGGYDSDSERNKTKQMLYVLAFVLLIRISLFIASYYGISVPAVAVAGSVALLVWRWYALRIHPLDVLKKTPWYIFIFAFNMYVVIYGLHNIGLTEKLVDLLEPFVQDGLLHASMTMGGLLSILSNVFNNHPALMVGTLALTNMELDPITLKTIYLANIIGSDMGSLLLPIGTLATLIWMHILKQYKVTISWKKYVKVTILVIPPTVIFTLASLYYWISWVFAGS